MILARIRLESDFEWLQIARAIRFERENVNKEPVARTTVIIASTLMSNESLIGVEWSK